eukprot:TRINITY_DN1481_c0_g1_i1.p1 TRINITY_DN1481_c0_g1~~TRINITY_DN1481_c0_g1_i1.p1  ORF type:complete len:381 (+),score=131.85 TRINITY_DN1481_c0_g1_i1:148-1290(+)
MIGVGRFFSKERNSIQSFSSQFNSSDFIWRRNHVIQLNKNDLCLPYSSSSSFNHHQHQKKKKNDACKFFSTSWKGRKEEENETKERREGTNLMNKEEEKRFRERIQKDLEKRFEEEKKKKKGDGDRLDWAKDEMGYPILKASADWIDQQKKERLEYIIKREEEDAKLMAEHFEKVKIKQEENAKNEKKEPLPEPPETMDYLYRRTTFSPASIRQNLKEMATSMRIQLAETINTSPNWKIDRDDDPRSMEVLRQPQSFKKLYYLLLALLGASLFYYFREEQPIKPISNLIGYYTKQARYKILGPSFDEQGIVSPHQFLVPKTNITKRYTLVIDPSILSRLAYDTDLGLRFRTRPAVEWFLTHVAKDYEIIIFHDGNWVVSS